MGLIGFVFSGGVKRNIGVKSCEKKSCRDFRVLGIGFVLHNRVNTTEVAENAERIGLWQDGLDGRVGPCGEARKGKPRINTKTHELKQRLRIEYHYSVPIS